jgi:hypothetical protein
MMFSFSPPSACPPENLDSRSNHRNSNVFGVAADIPWTSSGGNKHSEGFFFQLRSSGSAALSFNGKKVHNNVRGKGHATLLKECDISYSACCLKLLSPCSDFLVC